MAARYAAVLRGSKDLFGIFAMHGWFVLIIVATYVAGRMFALPLFILLYLLFVAREGWAMALTYTFCSWLLLWGMFDKIVHVVWQPPLLGFMPY